MRNTWLLIKSYAMSFLASIAQKRKNTKYITAVFLFLMFSCFLVIAFTTSAVSSTTIFLDLSKDFPGIEKLSMYNNCSMTMMIVILLTVMRSAYPKKEMNADMFLSLPLKKSEIIASKLFYYYIFDLFTIVGIVLPSFIVYAVMVPNAMSLKIAIALRGIALVIIIPFFTNAIASLVSAATNKLLAKTKYKKVFQTIILLLIISIYIIVYTLMQVLVGRISEGQNVAEIMNVYNKIIPIEKMTSFVLNGDLIAFLCIILVAVVPFILSTYLMIKNYGKRIDDVYYNKNKRLVFKKSNPLKTLYIKEIKYYFSLPIYVINTMMGAVIYIGISVIIRIIGIDKILLYMESVTLLKDVVSKSPEVVSALLLSLIITISVTTAVSISLEGKQFWIIKVNPISPLELFASKILVNLTITIFPVLIGAPIVASVVGWKYLWLLIIIPLLSTIFSAIAGLYVNIMYPKLEWENEEIPIKRSIASFLGLFIGGAVMIIPLVAYFIGLCAVFSPIQYAVIVILYQLLSIALICCLLLTRGVKYFNKITI